MVRAASRLLEQNLETFLPFLDPRPPHLRGIIRFPPREKGSAPRCKPLRDVPEDLTQYKAHETTLKNKKQALRAARDEIRSSLATSEKALEHLDAARRLESVVLAGPRGENLVPFSMALSQLDEAAAFLSKHKNGLIAAAAAAESVAALRSDGNALALREFEATTMGAYNHHHHHHHHQKHQQQQQQRQRQGLAAEEAMATTAATTTTAATETRLRSLARALVAGGGPEASSPSVVAFLSSKKEARR